MQLTRYTDYSLRILVYLASVERGASVGEIASFYGISRNHLSKVVGQLVEAELVRSVQGRGGGLYLACDPADVNIGDLVRATERLDLVECFDRETNSCPIASDCTLEHLLHSASSAFLAVLDEHTLADLMPVSTTLIQLGKRTPGDAP